MEGLNLIQLRSEILADSASKMIPMPCHRAYWDSPQPIVIAVHKPLKMIAADQRAGMPAFNAQTGRRECLSAWLRELEALYSVPKLFTIGRLDRKTTGLLLITNCGDLSYAVCFPGSCQKVYVAQVDGQPSVEQMDWLKEGVQLTEGLATAISVQLVSSIPLPITDPPKHRQRYRSQIIIAISVGWNRVVRRMLAAVGLPVMGLHRERIGELDLSVFGFREGEHSLLTPQQVASLWEGVGGKSLARERMELYHS